MLRISYLCLFYKNVYTNFKKLNPYYMSFMNTQSCKLYTLLFLLLTINCFGTIINVSNLSDNGAVGSLRYAITLANTTPALDTIQFTTNPSGTIKLLSALPQITNPIFIDGKTAFGYTAGNPAITIDAINRIGGNAIFSFGNGSSGSTLRALILNNIDNNGIYINSNGNKILGCIIGNNGSSVGNNNAGDGIQPEG
jgi:hypothetical protein